MSELLSYDDFADDFVAAIKHANNHSKNVACVRFHYDEASPEILLIIGQAQNKVIDDFSRLLESKTKNADGREP